MSTKHSRNILFLGYGYVAQYFCCNHTVANSHIAASINISKKKYFRALQKVEKIKFAEINDQILDHYNSFIISIPPLYQLKTDVIIDRFYNYFLKRKTPYQIIYLSSTSVYGDHDGQKVQENSSLKAKSINGLARIECENKYQTLKNNKLANIVILRLSAIYGDKRNNILSIYKKEITHNKSSNRMISRAHIADISSIIKKILLSNQIKNQIFNISDGNPCPSKELNNYICKNILKIDKLPLDKNLKESRHSSFALDNKIVDNRKIQEALNYKFIFPSYKYGLKQIVKTLKL